MTGLIADIGGTNARFALADADGTYRHARVLQCDDHRDLGAACQAYLADVARGDRPRRAAMAIASPVTGDRVAMTNHRWSFSIAETRDRLGLDDLRMLNDFAAVAHALPHLGRADLVPVGGGQAVTGAPIAVLGAGTGLGVAGLIPTGRGWRTVESEGGHVTMPAMTDREAAVLAILRGRFGHVSAERLLSGPGLLNLHQALEQVDGTAAAEAGEPSDVTGRALDGSCPRSVAALAMFAEMLGTVAADLALTLGARGGIYLAGGIVPRISDFLLASGFRSRFEDKGRFEPYLAGIPTFAIIHPLPAFVGLAHLVAEGDV